MYKPVQAPRIESRAVKIKDGDVRRPPGRGVGRGEGRCLRRRREVGRHLVLVAAISEGEASPRQSKKAGAVGRHGRWEQQQQPSGAGRPRMHLRQEFGGRERLARMLRRDDAVR